MRTDWRHIWRHMLTGALLALPSLTGAPASGLASGLDWTVVPEQSQVLFDYRRNDQPAEGHFAGFEGEGVFDRDAPGDATLELRIESASIDLDDGMASAFATSAEWFDSHNYPLVVYRLLKLTPEGGNRYHATGELTIRGRTRPIETTITIEIGDDEAHAAGSLRLNRKDYWLGVGPSALFVDIGREVAVRFDLIARPVR
jgi:polyisoprenoid-binding protein YceI